MMYQELFIDEARWAMGQPDLEEILQLVGQKVVIKFNSNDAAFVGWVIGVDQKGTVMFQQEIPFRAIESIEPV
jgi:hypothetical protein